MTSARRYRIRFSEKIICSDKSYTHTGNNTHQAHCSKLWTPGHQVSWREHWKLFEQNVPSSLSTALINFSAYCQAQVQVQVQVRCRSGSGDEKRNKLKDLDLSYTLNLVYTYSGLLIALPLAPSTQTLQHSHLLNTSQ